MTYIEYTLNLLQKAFAVGYKDSEYILHKNILLATKFNYLQNANQETYREACEIIFYQYIRMLEIDKMMNDKNQWRI